MSVPFVGRLKHVAFVKEATRGVYATAGTHFWVPWMTCTIDQKVMKERQTGAMGNIADSDAAFVTGKYAQGELEGEIRAEALGLLLCNVMGAIPASAGGSEPYTHTYTLQDTLNQHQSLSIVIQDPEEIGTTVYRNAMINSFNISIEPTGMVKYKIEFMASAGQDWTRLTPNFTALGDKYLHQHLHFKLADTIAALNSQTSADDISLKKFEITFSKNILIDWVDGTVIPGDLHNQQLAVEGSVTLNYQNRTYKNYMINGTYKCLEMELLKDANDTFTVQLPRVDFSEWEPSNELDSIVTQTMQFKGNYDAANAYKIIYLCTLINGTATY